MPRYKYIGTSPYRTKDNKFIPNEIYELTAAEISGLESRFELITEIKPKAKKEDADGNPE